MFTGEMDPITKAKIMLGIPESISVSPSALIMALAYEGDVFYLIRSGADVGDLGLPLPAGSGNQITPLPTDKISTVSRELKPLAGKDDVIYQRMSKLIDLENRLGIRLSKTTKNQLAKLNTQDLDSFQILQYLAPNPNVTSELTKIRGILQERQQFELIKNISEFRTAVVQDSPERGFQAEKVSRAISNSGFNLDTINTVLAIPVVGFGNQTDFINQTGTCLEIMDIGPEVLIVLNINRPTSQAADNSVSVLTNWAKKMTDRGVKTMTVDTQTGINGTKMGIVRSACFDGFILARNSVQDLNRISFVNTDDDNRQMPRSWLNQIRSQFSASPELSASFTRVDFSVNDTDSLFKTAERLRSTIATTYLNSIEFLRQKPIPQDKLADLLTLFFDGLTAGYIESTILSSFALRGNTYLNIGGFPPQDEITKTARLLFINALGSRADLSITPGQIITDNKRQLRAYLMDNVPPVAAWKSASARFLTDDVDPARVKQIVPSTISSDYLTRLESHLAITFEFMGITDPLTASRYLMQLGYDRDQIRVEQAGKGLYLTFIKNGQ